MKGTEPERRERYVNERRENRMKRWKDGWKCFI